METSSGAATRELVLIGGGHAHVQVLADFAAAPPPGVRLTVVADTPVAVYSGMVPGFVAGRYRAAELEIDILPLARRAGARLVVARCVGVDAAARRLLLDGRASLPYDVAAFDVGSTVAGRDLPGVREHALATRPIGRFVRRVDERLAAVGAAPRLVVVGGGAGGVELAFTLEARLRREGRPPASVTLVQRDDTVLPGYPAGLRWKVHGAAGRRGVTILTGRTVAAVERDAVALADGERLPSDLTVWVAGAVAHSLFRDSGLATDERGFLRVRSTLQAEQHDELFAAGDCASLIEHPATPKAGVYAVRMGPVLAANLRASLAGGRLRRYVPQGDFLALLNLGDGTALGAKWGLAVGGRWVMDWKDRIDRRFMRRFQVLAPDGEPYAPFRDELSRPRPAMACGGCAAKVGSEPLARALARLGPGPATASVALDLAAGDDAAAWRTPAGETVVASVDLFRAFGDDPWLVGAVAAINAVSDLYAMGVPPRHALAAVTVPMAATREAQEEALYQVLAGARAALDPLGVALVGGHSTTGPELAVGFAVDGLLPPGGRLLTRAGLAPGERLVLTKALGTGVLLQADMRGLLRGPWLETAVASMRHPNRWAARVAVEAGARAATDVSGFGLAGHLAEMLRASGVAAWLDLAALPALPGARELAARGVRSTFQPENERLAAALAAAPVAAAHPAWPLLFDPQTSGGLLFGVAPALAGSAVADLAAGGDSAATIVGEVTAARDDGRLIEVVAGPRAGR